MIKRIIYLLCFIPFAVACNPQATSQETIEQEQRQTVEKADISLEDIWMNGRFSAAGIWGMNPMKDGKSFSKIERGQFPSVVQYDFVTGDQLATIYDGTEHQLAFDSYQFNEDESKLFLGAETESIYRRSSKSQFYVYDVATGELTKLADGAKQSFPTFSPDNTKIAYVQENNLYYKDLTTNQTVAVTTNGKWNDVINGQSDWVYEEEFMITQAFAWSPNSEKIAYFSFDESNVKQFSMDYFGELYPEPYDFKYPKAGEQNSIVSTFVYDVPSAKTTEIETNKQADVYFPRMKWMPSNELVVVRMNRHQNKIELLKVNERTGTTSTLLEETNPYYISESVLDEMEFLSDGRFLWTSEQDGFKHVYLYDANGELIRQITSGNYDISTLYGVDEQEGKIYYQAAKQSPLNREVYSQSLNGGEAELLTLEQGWNSAQFTDSFDYFIHTYSNKNQPNIITVKTDEGELVRTLEDNASLKSEWAATGLSEKEFFIVETVDGTELNAWIMKPSYFEEGQEYPLLLFVYGGPGSQTVQNSWGSGNYWWHAYMAEQGYIIASVDNRGTGARGQEFKKMTYQELGKYEVEDQIAAAKHLGSLDYIDEQRIGIWGWSYGGYMSSLALFKASDVFSTAIAVAPVSNWRYYDTIYTERYMRTPQENASGYDDNSPINYVDGLEGNYLLVHGMADDNVHFQNTVDLISALNTAGKQYDLAIYPNKNHGIYGGNTRFHLFEKMTNFIVENL